MNWLWRNQLLFTQRPAAIQQGSAATQLMFNHTQTSAATTLETDLQSSQLSQPPLEEHSVCCHPQTFYWILFSTMQPKLPESKNHNNAAGAAWKKTNYTTLMLLFPICFSCYRLHPTPWIYNAGPPHKSTASQGTIIKRCGLTFQLIKKIYQYFYINILTFVCFSKNPWQPTCYCEFLFTLITIKKQF